MTWGAVDSFAYAISTCTFDTVHWLFAFEYFTIAKTMPLALRGIQLAAETYKVLKIVKYSGVVICFLLAIASGLIFYFSFKTASTDNEAKHNSLKSAQNALTVSLAVF